jgi:hypothetical protein
MPFLKKRTLFGQLATGMTIVCAPIIGGAHEQAANRGGCQLNSGQEIATQATPTLPEIAAASFDRFTGKPIIYFNPWAVSRLPPAFREFVHAHECAHHRLDHLRAGPVGSVGEAEADCWAAAELTAQGVLSPNDIAVVGKVLAALLPGDRNHRSGHLRASELQRCVRYVRTTTPEALAAAKLD